MLGISALTLFCHHIVLTATGTLTGIVVLLLFGIPPKRPEHTQQHRHIGHHLLDFLHAFWPIAFTAVLYLAFDLPPAVGILIAIFGLLILHKVPAKKWSSIFKAACEPDMVLLIFGAMFFKINLETSGAIGNVVDFLTNAHVPPKMLVFLLPFIVSFATGVTMPTVAITYPFLIAFMGKGPDAKMGIETLAFSGLLFGLWLTPVHLCIALSASYFQTSLFKIISKLFIPAAAVAAAGTLMAIFLG